ncbi:MAG: formyltransferase family protein, partial [Rhodobacteraceae bacterium]|nr:formyltransferase family protein [Paracoccaceae bacterium]
MKRVAILISGGGANMGALAASMKGDHSARPVMVISNDPKAKGLERAHTLGLPTAAVDHRPFVGDRAAFEDALMAH